MQYRILGVRESKSPSSGSGQHFGGRNDEPSSSQVTRPGLRPWRQLHRHRRLLQPRQVGGSDREMLKVIETSSSLPPSSLWPWTTYPNSRGASRYHIFNAVEDSLRRLNTDHIDLYHVHWPDPETPIEQTLRALDDLVKQGKIRYFGSSNFSGPPTLGSPVDFQIPST